MSGKTARKAISAICTSKSGGKLCGAPSGGKLCGAPSGGKPFLAAATPEQLAAFVADAGESAYRAEQIRGWVTRQFVTDPAQMTNLSAALRKKLSAAFVCGALKREKTEECADGSKKLLLSLPDGETVECAVLEALDGRKTFCLSSQVGCPVRCVFCASGDSGFIRNLAAGEIIEQYLLCCRVIGRAPDNVVMMGVGEPLLNFASLAAALDTICDPAGIGLAARRVTVSTSGWTPGIRALAQHGRQWNLAVSLHGGDDKTRALLIPAKFRCAIRGIIESCRLHQEATGRLLTIAYVLLAHVNDSVGQALRLAAIAREANAKVNLIPYNQARGVFERPGKEVIKKFAAALKMHHVPVTVRVEKGFAANAACGQLRSSAGRKKERKES